MYSTASIYSANLNAPLRDMNFPSSTYLHLDTESGYGIHSLHESLSTCPYSNNLDLQADTAARNVSATMHCGSEGSSGDQSPPTMSELNSSSSSAASRSSSPREGVSWVSDDDAINESLQTIKKRADMVTGASCSRDTNKPSHSYIGLISMAILSAPDKRMILGDIYSYIMDHFPYYDNGNRAWRNSIRHNLSLNECFVKSGRAENGKGNYWSIHHACLADFGRGDFRRRHARQRAKKSNKVELEVSKLPLGYRSNLGYVAMTATHLAYPMISNWLHASSNNHVSAVPVPYQPMIPTYSPMTYTPFDHDALYQQTRFIPSPQWYL